jgi:uncharacterized membrane protein
MFEPTQRTSRTVWWAAAVFFVLVVADSWFRWKTFQYQTADLASYVQGLWQILNGRGNASLLDASIMGNHAEPIIFLLLPFFWIWKHPMTLVVIQTALLATMPFTAKRIALHMEFSPRAATGLGLAMLLAPAAGFGALHEFHPEALAAPFILLMIEARMKGMTGLHFLWFLLALACGENIALMLGWMGVVHFVLERSKGREWQTAMNVVPAIVAISWVLAYTLLLGPKWNGGRVDSSGLYSHLSADGGILKNLYTKPGLFFSAFWQGLKGGNLVWGLLLPFIFLPVLRLRWMMIAVPLFLQHLLSWQSSEWQINLHHGLPLLPLMWIAATEAAARLFWRDAVATYIIAACVVVQLWFGPLRAIGRTISTAGPEWQKSRVHADLLATVSPGDSVTASFGFLPHLAKRDDLQSLHLVSQGMKTPGGIRYIPRAADHVLVDYSDQATFSREAATFHPKLRTANGEIVPSSDELMHRWLRENHLSASTFWDSCAHFFRSEPERASLSTATAKRVDEKTQLIAVEHEKPAIGELLKLKLTWEFGEAREFFPWVKLALSASHIETYLVAKGPVLPGAEGGQFSEVWTIKNAGVPPGKYKAWLLIQDPLGTGKFKGFKLPLEDVEVR